LSREVYCLDLDQRCMNLPITDAFELGELFLRRFGRPFSARRRANDDRPLAAAEELIISGNFVDEAHAIGRHLARSQCGFKAIMTQQSTGLDDLDQFWHVQRTARPATE
jgi:hypothetical protein